jgi:hypothetical protein
LFQMSLQKPQHQSELPFGPGTNRMPQNLRDRDFAKAQPL